MSFKKYNDKLIAMDLDGTLCFKESWSINEVINAKPISKHIEINNNLYKAGAHIIIYTARPEMWRAETVYWLHKNGVRYHALEMNYRKLGADFYIDDKSLIINNLK